MLVRLAWLLLLLAVGSCARPYPPPGGESDRTPPRLIGTSPEPLQVAAPTAEPAVFRFDGDISERGFSEALVIVSPLDGGLRVERDGNEVRVGIDGGWRADRVYRIMLLPGLRDRFGNERREPVELVFSTGPPVTNSALAGIVFDRITGQAAPNAVIDAVRRADTVRYMTVADSTGFFSLRHLPLGAYELRAYSDANRNRRRDLAEPLDSGMVASLTAQDTVTQVFHVLAPDTSAPRITSADAIDSLHVRVVLDDHVTAEAAEAASARVLLLPDSSGFAGAADVTLEPVFTAMQRAASVRTPTAAADTLTQDTAAADTMVSDTVAADTVTVDPASAARADSLAAAQRQLAAARADSAVAAARERPARQIVVRLDRPLRAGTEYVIVVDGIRNLHGLVGSSVASFETPEPPPAVPPADSTASMAAAPPFMAARRR